MTFKENKIKQFMEDHGAAVLEVQIVIDRPGEYDHIQFKTPDYTVFRIDKPYSANSSIEFFPDRIYQDESIDIEAETVIAMAVAVKFSKKIWKIVE